MVSQGMAGALIALMVGIVGSEAASAEAKEKIQPELRAMIETTHGKITVVLYEKKAPKTVANFVGLATGAKEWTDPKTGKKVNRPLYDGSIFHRVIPGFMIQGGDPRADGTGGPGYLFEDEITPDLTFDRAGRLAMANSGPNTNGSQFFITEAPTDWLSGKHSIFGQVVEGQEVVHKIALAERDNRDRPKANVVIKKIQIIK